MEETARPGLAEALSPGGAAPPAAEAFIMELGRALLRFGTPAHRLEAALGLLSQRLGLVGQFYSTPTALIASFAGGPAPRTYVERCEPGDVNLEKLVLLDAVTEQVVNGTLPPPEGAARVESILAAPPRFGLVSTTAAYALAAAALAFAIGGGWEQAAVAGGIGLAVGGLAAMTRAVPPFGRVFELAAAALASFLAHAWAGRSGPDAVYLTTVTGLIVLVPGLALTVAMTELSTLNLVSGTARLAGAGVTLLKLAFGVALGGRLGAVVFPVAAAGELESLPEAVKTAALVLAALAFIVLFQAPPRDTGWILVASAVAVAGTRGGVALLGPELGPCLGALLVTGGANLYGLLLQRPSRVVLVPSLLFLVPGSIGFRSVSFLLQRDVLGGVSTAFSMALASVALAAGVLLANVIVPPRRLL